jgi:hypothetical protein
MCSRVGFPLSNNQSFHSPLQNTIESVVKAVYVFILYRYGAVRVLAILPSAPPSVLIPK